MGFVSAIIKGAIKEAAKSAKKSTKAKGLATKQEDYSSSASLPKKESDANFTEAFKDTTIIDKEGKPEVVYHGRVQDYDSFDTSGDMSTGKELGTHFGTKEQTDVFASKEGGNVVPVYLNLKNPYHMVDSGSFNGEDIIEQLVEDGLVDSSYIDDLDLPIQELNILAKKLLKEKGFDGISYINTREGLSIKGKPITSQKKIDELQDYDLKTLIEKYGAKKSYIILEPEQAKSVFNKGSWDSKDKRFNYAKGGNVDQNNLKTHDGLPTVKSDSGEDMSEVSITVTDPRLNKGKPTNIPSLWNGQIVSEDEAIENALNTNNEYRSFESIKEAVDDAIRKSDAGGANAPEKYAKGGNVEQMNKLFADGGMMDDSGESVNGVEVPPGSLREEVADDIPAQLSEGEFVVPADVVRYIGLEKLMAMRDKAKQGLQRMNEMGQMGNAEEVANPDQTFSEQGDEDFEAEIDDIMAEEGDDAMPEGFALGGIVTEADIPKMEWTKNPVVDVRYFKHPDGRVMFITYLNGKPSTSIPEGFKETKEPVEKLVGKAADEKEAAKSITDVSGSGETQATPEADYGKMAEFYAQNPTAAKAAAKVATYAQSKFAFLPETPYAKAQKENFNNALKGIDSSNPNAIVTYNSDGSIASVVGTESAKGTIEDAESEVNTDASDPPGRSPSSDTDAGYSGGTASEGGQPGTDYGDPGYGNMFAKGGMVKKRPAKAKPTKKGLAAKK